MTSLEIITKQTVFYLNNMENEKNNDLVIEINYNLINR